MRAYLVAALLFSLTGMNMAQQPSVPVDQEPHHHVVLKNDYVEVMHVTIPPGASTLFHTHSHDRVAVHLSDSTIALQQPGKAEDRPSPVKPGEITAPALEGGPYTHKVHNVGSSPFEVLDVEILQKSNATSSPIAEMAAENPSARVYRWVLAPGATTAQHTHERPYLIVAATSMQLKMTAPDGQSFTHEIKAGDFHWVDAKVTHSLSNQGSEEGQIVEVELK